MAALHARRPSPTLGAAAAAIGEASTTLVPRESRFRHSFEAPVDSIVPDPGQARRRFDEAELAGLAATMAEQGQLQPILLRRDPSGKARWMIVAGERRWRAAVANGWRSVLAIEHDGDAEVASLIENLQRVDLNPVEEVRGLQRLIGEKGWSQAEAARALGRSKGAVSGLLRVLTLPNDLLEGVLTSELAISKNVMVELARVEEPATREQLIALARTGALTVRALRDALAVVAERGGEGGKRPAAAKPTRSRPGGADLVPGLRRVTARLHTERLTGRALAEGERRWLLALKGEIEGWLGKDAPQPPNGTEPGRDSLAEQVIKRSRRKSRSRATP
jgi:ParB family transcriptional regulator, chromosome partitioning protein